MKFRWHWFVLIPLLGATGVAPEAEAQFNPRGRSKKPPTKSSPQPPRTPRATPDRPAPVPPESETKSAEERRETLIARYRKVIVEQPEAEVPMMRLMELVRERDGNLDALVDDLEQVIQRGTGDEYAALIALGRIHSENGNRNAAIDHLAKAAKKHPNRPAAWLTLSEMYREGAQPQKARHALRQALPHVTGPEREMTLRNLRDSSLDLGDYESAKKRHRQLVQGARGNVFLKGELGRELLRRGKTQRALQELKKVAEASRGDNRALVPALRDLGKAQIAAQEWDEAIATLRRASRLSVAQPGLRREIDELRAEAHAAKGSLPQYIEELEAVASNATRLELVGRLYEQEGKPNKAAEAYQKALQRDPKNVDIRLKLVRLFELTGQIDAATDAYGDLTQAAPRDVNLSLRYMEMLLARGERQRVLQEFDRIERRTRDDPNAAFLLADFAHRIEELGREKAILARLEKQGLRDPRHLIELGNRAYREGDEEAARRLWQRVVSVHPDPAKAHVLLGEALLDHEQPEDGVAALQKAARLKPQSLRIARSLALGLQRAAAQSDKPKKRTYEKQALVVWERILEGASGARSTSGTEARRQIVRLWRRTDQLRDNVVRLRARFEKSGDLDSGRLLAEAQLQLGKNDAAEATLRKILQAEPGDRRSLEKLESVQAKTGRYAEATKTLKRLVEIDPGRARHYYERMARYAAREKNDDLALQFAEEAVRLDPGDAEAQARLGDLYSEQGKLDEAEKAYRAALSKNERLNEVSLRLARLLTKKGEVDEALELAFHALRTAKDEGLLTRAGRLALGVSVPAGKAGKLESVLRPLTIAHPKKKVYRRLLMETLAAEMYPLVQSDSKDALQALAERNLQPLLSAIADDEGEQHRIAIELLGYGNAKQAGAALLEFASSSADSRTRMAAVLSAGRLADPSLVPRLEELLLQSDAASGGPLARAAAWSLASLEHARAAPSLLAALASGDPVVRGYAVLGLGALQNAMPGVKKQEVTHKLSLVLSDESEGPLVRAAAAAALSRFPESAAANSALETATTAQSKEIASHAVAALVRRAPKRASTLEVAAQALAQRQAEIANACALALAEAYGDPTPHALVPDLGDDPVLDLRSHLDSLLSGDPDRAGQQRATVAIAEAFLGAAEVAASTSKAGALSVARAIEPSEEGLALRPLIEGVTKREKAYSALARVRSHLTPVLASLVNRSDDTEVRQAALSALTLGVSERADQVIQSALLEGPNELKEAALYSITRSGAEPATALVEMYLQREDRWTMRRRAVQILTKLHQDATAPTQEKIRALLEQLSEDPNPLVSEHAQEALDGTRN